MNDEEFKRLPHASKGYKLFKRGKQVMKGYIPDFVLKKEDREQFIILEYENSSSRKHILGGFVKASRFLSDDRQGILIFVIGKKSVEAIANHLQEYLNWMSCITNLHEVWIISIDEYVSVMKKIKSEEFRIKGVCLNPTKK